MSEYLNLGWYNLLIFACWWVGSKIKVRQTWSRVGEAWLWPQRWFILHELSPEVQQNLNHQWLYQRVLVLFWANGQGGESQSQGEGKNRNEVHLWEREMEWLNWKQNKTKPHSSSLIQLSGGQGWTSYLAGGCSDQQELPIF